jgi:hypothetical protein
MWKKVIICSVVCVFIVSQMQLLQDLQVKTHSYLQPCEVLDNFNPNARDCVQTTGKKGCLLREVFDLVDSTPSGFPPLERIRSKVQEIAQELKLVDVLHRNLTNSVVVVWVIHDLMQHCGSCQVLVHLACTLKFLGVKVYLYFKTRHTNSSEITCNPIYPGQEEMVVFLISMDEVLTIRNKVVAVYNQLVQTNPFRVRRFVLWQLYYQYEMRGNNLTTRGESIPYRNGTAVLCQHDYCFPTNKKHKAVHVPNMLPLNLDYHGIMPDGCRTAERRPKFGSIYMIRKGQQLFPKDYNFTNHDNGTIEEVLQIPTMHLEGPPEVICAQCAIKRVFYTYDPITWYSVIASLCGCISVVVTPSVQRHEPFSDLGVFYWTPSEKMIKHHLMNRRYARTLLYYEEKLSVVHLIRFVLRMDNWNQYYEYPPPDPWVDGTPQTMDVTSMRCYVRFLPVQQQKLLGRNLTAIRLHYRRFGTLKNYCPSLTDADFQCFYERYGGNSFWIAGALTHVAWDDVRTWWTRVGRPAGFDPYCATSAPELESLLDSTGERREVSDEELVWCASTRIRYGNPIQPESYENATELRRVCNNQEQPQTCYCAHENP